MRFALAVLSAFFILAVAPSVHAITWKVPAVCPTIQTGIDSASAGDTVSVASGTYSGPGNRDISFGGKDIVVLSEDGPGLAIINCEGGPDDVHRGFYFDGEISTSVLQGFTITGGYARRGGAVYCETSSPTIRNCAFARNAAWENGGGVACLHGSSPSLSYCVFFGNAANLLGGGVFCEDSSSPAIENCSFSDNSAMRGGGVYAKEASSPNVVNCVVAFSHGGRPVHCDNASPTVSCCDFFANAGGDDFCGVDAGGNFSEDPLFCDQAAGDLTVCALSPCLPENNGCGVLVGALGLGGCPCPECTVLAVPTEYTTITGALAAASYCDTVLVYPGTYTETISLPWGVVLMSTAGPDSTVIDGGGNGAVVSIGYPVGKPDARDVQAAVLDGFTITGGTASGIRVQHCDPVIKNCIIRDNSGPSGAGLECRFSSLTLLNSTFSGNSGEFNGTIFFDCSSPTISNCIIAFAPRGRAVHCYNSSFPTFTCCNLYGNAWGDDLCGIDGGGNLSQDPLFCDRGAGDLRLCASSPCLPENNDCGVLIGALGFGDCPCPECRVLTVPHEYATLTDALAVASCCDTVLVYPGKYAETISLPWGVTLTSVAGPDSTVIDGGGEGTVVLVGYGRKGAEGRQAPPATLNGFTITGGSDSGIRISQCSPVITDCVITGNSGTSGGGVSCDHASTIFAGCTISNNVATGSGGGIICEDGWPQISVCTFSGNTAEDGGGLFLCAVEANVTGCVFSENAATQEGGGISIDTGTLNLSQSTLAGNAAGYGGGVYIGWVSNGYIDHSIIAFGSYGEAVRCHGLSYVELSCSDLYGNVGGDWIGCVEDQAGINGNLYADPLFCDLENGDYHLWPGSPCMDAPDCGLVGALGEGCPCPSPRVVWYILPDGTGDAPTIQAGIDSACAGRDTVLVGPGTYTGQGNRDIRFAGKLIVVRSEEGPEATVINCEGSIEEIHRGFRFDYYETPGSVLEGFTIRGGYARYGGAVHVLGTSPTIRNCIFTGNTAWQDGGAIACDNFSLSTIEYCTFVNNDAEASGGGMYCGHGSSPSLSHCTFYGNSAADGGGIMTNDYSHATGQNTIIAFGAGGGAVDCDIGSTATLSCCDVFGNAGGDWHGCIAGQYPGEGNLREDPLFCDPANGDFRIEDLSPCAPDNSPPGCGLIGSHDVGCSSTTLAEEEMVVPTRLELVSIVPNPFNPVTEISYALPIGPGLSRVRLTIYTPEGRRVLVLVDRPQAAGFHRVAWDGADGSGAEVATGVYFCRLEWNGESRTGKLVLLK